MFIALFVMGHMFHGVAAVVGGGARRLLLDTLCLEMAARSHDFIYSVLNFCLISIYQLSRGLGSMHVVYSLHS